MKRFGEKAALEAIANGAIVRAWDWYTLNAGYRVIIDGEQAGYITGDLFAKLKNSGAIVKDVWAHSYTDYKAPTAEEALEAAEDEKTAQEWAEESDRVHEATAAALAPVLVAEEAEEEAAPEYLDERWPESNTAPGIAYILEWNIPGGRTQHTGLETVADVHSHVQQIKNKHGIITKATRWDKNAGKFRDFIPETRQEKTDRENWEHCRRIAEDMEAYADGNVYKCPDCGAEYTWEQIEATEHEDDEGWAVYTCRHCDAENQEDDWEQQTLYDYFSDCLDIEYRCGSDRKYRSVSIMVACGGPNIYIDTAEKAVLLYWWTDRARYYLSSDACEAVDNWAREYWEIL